LSTENMKAGTVATNVPPGRSRSRTWRRAAVGSSRCSRTSSIRISEYCFPGRKQQSKGRRWMRIRWGLSGGTTCIEGSMPSTSPNSARRLKRGRPRSRYREWIANRQTAVGGGACPRPVRYALATTSGFRTVRGNARRTRDPRERNTGAARKVSRSCVRYAMSDNRYYVNLTGDPAGGQLRSIIAAGGWRCGQRIRLLLLLLFVVLGAEV
jgi:hypothetical protein